MDANDVNTPIKLEVMVAAYGRECLTRLAEPGHLEPTPGVRYLVSLQTDDSPAPAIPEALKSRPDIIIKVSPGKGVARNRNILLDMATAPYLLVADADIAYKSENLRKIIEVFDDNPSTDIAAFKANIDEPRPYPTAKRRLEYKRWERNFYPYAVECAFRRASIENCGLRFDERYGRNADVLGAGEEDVLLFDAWRAGLTLHFYPVEILRHKGSTTVIRHVSADDVTMGRGAVLRHIYGRMSWLYRARLAAALPGNKFANWILLRKGAIYERKTNKN